MRATINAALLKRLSTAPLPASEDIRDTSLKGFVLRWRRSGVHTYRVATGRGKWYTLGTADKLSTVQAREKAKEVLANVALGEDPVEERRTNRNAKTFEDFVRHVYQPWAVTNLRTGQETVDRLLNHFPDFRRLPLPTISAFHVERWRSARRKAGIRLRDGVKAGTINRDLAALKALLARAVEWKHLPSHPLQSVRPERMDRRGVVRFLSLDEEDRLRAALVERDAKLRDERASANAWRAERGYELYPEHAAFPDHVHPVVLLALNTGLRRGELFGLRWSDIDLDARRLTVRAQTAKSGQTRYVPLANEAISTLTTWGRQSAGLVFPSATGPDVPLTDIKKAWGALLRRAGIRDFRFHDLRHTFASRLVQRDVDLNKVRELLGHASLTMTLRYAHLRDEDLASAVAVLDAMRR